MKEFDKRYLRMYAEQYPLTPATRAWLYETATALNMNGRYPDAVELTTSRYGVLAVMLILAATICATPDSYSADAVHLAQQIPGVTRVRTFCTFHRIHLQDIFMKFASPNLA